MIICILATIPLKWIAPSIAAHKVGAPATHAISHVNNADITPEIDRDANRIALVIGNGNYADDPLANPINDARAISITLEMLGFKVLHYENLTQQGMKGAILEFDRRLRTGGVGLFYFSGHGLQIASKTLLIPIDLDRRSPARLLTQGIDLRAVLDSMSRPRPDKLNLIVLDTCLNNPFQSGNGRAVDIPTQTLIAYATAPGSIAADATHHGLYTVELLKGLIAPGQDVADMFRGIASAVRRTSNQQQIPWVSSSLPDKFRFVMSSHRVPVLERPIWTRSATAQSEAMLATRGRGILPKDSAEQYELTFWESIKDSTHASDYEAYLQAYPNGRFAALARARIERLRTATPKAEVPAEPTHQAPATKAAPARVHPAPAAKKTPLEQPRPAPAAAPSPPPSPGKAAAVSELKTCPTCPALIALSPGSFAMGSNSSDPTEKPAHHVSIKKPFAIGKYEVTVGQWNACVDAGGCPHVLSDTDRANTNMPVRNVSWDDAQQYVKWLSGTSGKPYRLPTEAEWEYAARGGTATRYWWGEQMRPGKANCKECGEPWRFDAPSDVGSFAPNPYGLYDMNGSVWEWVSDCWHNSYKSAPADARAWDEPNCRTRVIRGGSWRQGGSYMLSSTRFKYDASVRESQNGFRVASDLK
ncbi:MAG TPA: SUMF1/EgtB/PvdO family nonheme iron enzyme [Burkholderiaceae bacterium]|nr:SUMF1/EgtB/PvdO family nonheme iron enzyme [Burkholderiaceae bacterium]